MAVRLDIPGLAQGQGVEDASGVARASLKRRIPFKSEGKKASTCLPTAVFRINPLPLRERAG
jgi:hypothetical protein